MPQASQTGSVMAEKMEDSRQHANAGTQSNVQIHAPAE
jgi:hypothetical protein